MIPIYKKGQGLGNKRFPEAPFLELYKAEWLNDRGIDAAVFFHKMKPLNISGLLRQIEEFTQFFKNDSPYKSVGIIGFSACTYPAITMIEPFLHAATKEDTPKTFIWHIAEDYCSCRKRIVVCD